MRLLNVKEQKKKDEAEKNLQIARAKETAEELTTKRVELNNIQDTFSKTLDEQNKTFEEQQAQQKAQKDTLKAEVDILENRKKQALLPLEEREKAIHDKEQELGKAFAALDVERADFQTSLEGLHSHLDAVAERELNVSRQEELLHARARGIETQSASIKAQSAQLSEQLQSFSAASQKRATELKNWEDTLRAVSEEHLMAREQFGKKEQDLRNRELALRDKYKQLEITTKEIEEKYGRRPL